MSIKEILGGPAALDAYLNSARSGAVSVLKIFNPFCPPCMFIAQPYEELSQELTPHGVRFAMVSTMRPENYDLMTFFGMPPTPTFVIFKAGRGEVGRVTGINLPLVRKFIQDNM